VNDFRMERGNLWGGGKSVNPVPAAAGGTAPTLPLPWFDWAQGRRHGLAGCPRLNDPCRRRTNLRARWKDDAMNAQVTMHKRLQLRAQDGHMLWNQPLITIGYNGTRD